MPNTISLEREREQAKLSPPPSAPNKLARLLRASGWLVVSALVALFCIEFILRLSGSGGQEFSKGDPILGFSHLENKRICIREEGYSNDLTSSAGFRDVERTVAKPAGVKRIAFIGDSVTEAMQVPLKDGFVSLLDRELDRDGRRVEAMNFGMASYSTGQECLSYVVNARKYQPDILVVAYHINDTDETPAPGKNSGAMPRPYFTVADNNRVSIDWSFLDNWMNGQESRLQQSCDWLRRHSYIWGALMQARLSLNGDKVYTRICKLADPLVSRVNAALSPPHEVVVSDPVKEQRRTIESEFATPINCPPVTEEIPLAGDVSNSIYKTYLNHHRVQFKVTGALLRQLKRMCDADNCRLVVVGLPAADPPLYYTRELKGIAEVARQQDFTFIDLQERFLPLLNDRNVPMFGMYHLSPAGHKMVARELQPTLERMLETPGESQ